MNSIVVDWGPLLLTAKLGLIATGILFVGCLPLAWWLSGSKSAFLVPLKALMNMPLVLPPTVLGFYLLITLSPSNPLGGFIEHVFHIRLLFTFTGIVIGAILFSLPFMVNPLISGFESLPSSISEAAAVLGKSKLTTLFTVLLPNMKSSLLTALVMTFAHTIGEFGVVLMIGGKIPGATRVASIAIYDEIESLNYGAANGYALVLIVLSFAIVLSLFYANRKVFGVAWS